MPVEPEVQDDIVVTLPQDVPVREGEERFQTGLNMEDGRRKDSEIAELRAQLKRLEGTSANEMRTKFAASPTARKRQISARKLHERLSKETYKRGDRWEGPCAPFTVINLNPVPLTLQGELQRWTVPPAGKGEPIEMAFRGRKFTGAYLTVRTPHIYAAHTGTANDKQSGVDMPSVEYQYITPSGLVHQFYDHYVTGAADAQNMGGIVIFEGDIRTLDPKHLARTEGTIWVPKKETTLEGYGDVVYITEPVKLVDFMEASVVMQRNYADFTIAEGHSFSNSKSEIIQNQLSNYHRTWHNFALAMGYIEEPLPWAVERMKDTPSSQAIYCPDCRNRQKDPEQYFCENCNAPFNALKAFLAGKTVSEDRLFSYEGEELEAVLGEIKRRTAKIAMLREAGLQTATEANKGAQRGPDGKFLPRT